MRSVEKTGKTVNDAVTEALIELGASTEEVDIEVISKGSKGFIGFGAKDARVRVTLKAPVEIEPPIEEILQEKEEIKQDLKVELNLVETHKKAVKKDSEDAVVVTEGELHHVQQLAEEFLYKLLKEMNIEAVVKSEVVNNNRLSISLEGKNMGVIIGKRGEAIKRIGSYARQDIEKLLDTQVYLELWVKVREDWRNKSSVLKELGYTK